MAVASNDEAMRRSIFAFDSGSSIAARSAVCTLCYGWTKSRGFTAQVGKCELAGAESGLHARERTGDRV